MIECILKSAPDQLRTVSSADPIADDHARVQVEYYTYILIYDFNNVRYELNYLIQIDKGYRFNLHTFRCSGCSLGEHPFPGVQRVLAQ